MPGISGYEPESPTHICCGAWASSGEVWVEWQAELNEENQQEDTKLRPARCKRGIGQRAGGAVPGSGLHGHWSQALSMSALSLEDGFSVHARRCLAVHKTHLPGLSPQHRVMKMGWRNSLDGRGFGPRHTAPTTDPPGGPSTTSKATQDSGFLATGGRKGSFALQRFYT